ncbi:thermonuclease family protein [Alsobacter sp. R-9]
MSRILRRPVRVLVTAALAVVVSGLLARLGPLQTWLERRQDLAGAVSVIDGDSLRLAGVELRLEGIDAPELAQTCLAEKGEVACGRMAREGLAGMSASGPVQCRVGREDRFGRGLALCRAGDLDINREMVRRGLAVSFGRYEADEAEARQARRGIWAMRFEPPSAWRGRHPRP